ncbi:hypothetical protein B0H12DRAFT_1074885 [Mycena haematopus]|nr:hypothetical protein B0H12DRAFT_1074885 [Mycena haematopus]
MHILDADPQRDIDASERAHLLRGRLERVSEGEFRLTAGVNTIGCCYLRALESTRLMLSDHDLNVKRGAAALRDWRLYRVCRRAGEDEAHGSCALALRGTCRLPAIAERPYGFFELLLSARPSTLVRVSEGIESSVLAENQGPEGEVRGWCYGSVYLDS